MVPCCHSRPTGHKKDEPGIYISKLCVIFKWLKTVCYSTWYIYYEKTWKVQIFYDMPWTYIYIQTHTYRVLNFLFLRGFQRIYTYRNTCSQANSKLLIVGPWNVSRLAGFAWCDGEQVLHKHRWQSAGRCISCCSEELWLILGFWLL